MLRFFVVDELMIPRSVEGERINNKLKVENRWKGLVLYIYIYILFFISHFCNSSLSDDFVVRIELIN